MPRFRAPSWASPRVGRPRPANQGIGPSGGPKQRYKPGRARQVAAGLRGAKPGLDGARPKPAPKPRPAAKPLVGRSAQPDSLYHRQVDLVTRKEEQRLGELEGQEQSIKHEFGIDDPTNPFSRAEGLKRLYLAKYRGASAGLAARGHLYSGAHERALARTRREEEEARANLRRAYEQAIGQIGAERAGVTFATEEERAQAFEDWLARAPESEPAPEAAAPPTPAAAVPAAPKPPSGRAITGEQTPSGSRSSAGLSDPFAKPGPKDTVGSAEQVGAGLAGDRAAYKQSRARIRARRSKKRVRLTPAQKRAVARRTTESSRRRAIQRFRAANRRR